MNARAPRGASGVRYRRFVGDGTGVAAEKASFAIAARYRLMIARGELLEGQPLPVESELIEELGFSKGVVREALRILETEGLVEVRRGLGGGPRVRHPSIAQAARTMGVYLQIGDVAVRDVWESRERMVGAAVERLARDGGDIDALAESVGRLRQSVGCIDVYYLRMLDVEDTAVLATGSRTDHVIVASLRHIIAVELEQATRSVVDMGKAVADEDLVARAWSDVLRHIRAGRPAAARRAYERQGVSVRVGVLDWFGEGTVGEVMSG